MARGWESRSYLATIRPRVRYSTYCSCFGRRLRSVRGNIVFVEGIFLRHPPPQPFPVFVDGESQFLKHPLCGFIVFCRDEPRTELPSRKNSHASRSFSKKPKQSGPKSLSCNGLQMAGGHFEKSCASSGRFRTGSYDPTASAV